MMKNKAYARVAATGQRSISLLLLQGFGGRRQRQRGELKRRFASHYIDS